jgi:quercetin dioxygenase-like cupin family protein
VAIRIFHRDRPDLTLPMIAKDARLVVWLGNGSRTANMNFVDMQPGESNIRHAHPESEDTIFIIEGQGTVEDFSNGLRFDIRAGQVVHVPVGIEHAVTADKGSNIVSVGGPAPADEQMLRNMGVDLQQ